MNAQFKRGIVELCVLSEVRREEMYGYKLIDTISEHLDVNDNTIYPILRRLTKDGYFETYLKESDKGAPRKYYKITSKGQQQYEELMDSWEEFIQGVSFILRKGGDRE